MRGYVTRIEGVCPVCAEKVYVDRMVYLAAVKKLKAEDEAKKSKL
jgi:hypothetical protein